MPRERGASTAAACARVRPASTRSASPRHAAGPPCVAPCEMRVRRRSFRERLALTEWVEVAALFLLLAFVVSVPLLYSAARGVDVERPWVIATVLALAPVLLV